MAPALSTIWLYRIIHIADLGDVLERGMFARHHPAFSPPRMRLGDIELAEKRDNFTLQAPAQGTIGDHVAFYLGPYSPMLLRIHTGRNVQAKTPQRDVAYLLVRFADVCAANLAYVLTDGHANQRFLTRTFTTPEGLDHVDWDVVQAQYWNDTEEDPDRMRRKQAECLVRGHVPPELVHAIGVYDDDRCREVADLVARAGHRATARTDHQRRLFYP